jgi:hypothetical protein
MLTVDRHRLGTRSMSYETHDRLPGARHALRGPVAAGVVVATIVIGLALLDHDSGTGVAVVSSSPSTGTPSPATAREVPDPSDRLPLRYPWVAIDPGWIDLRVRGPAWQSRRWVRLMAPAGWAINANGTLIERYPVGSPTMNLSVHRVSRVAADACDASTSSVEIGTADDLAAALANQAGVYAWGPTETTLDRYPAAMFVLAAPPDCGSPEGGWLWEDDGGHRFGPLEGGSTIVYVIDVAGDPIALAVRGRDASSRTVAELRAMVDSIDIQAP